MQVNSIADSAVLYCRISKDAEGDELGVKRQLADCTALADRLGLTVVDTYIDNDTGASDRTNKKAIRHEYIRMLADGREGITSQFVLRRSSRWCSRLPCWSPSVRDRCSSIPWGNTDPLRSHELGVRLRLEGSYSATTALSDAVPVSLPSRMRSCHGQATVRYFR